MRLFPIKVDDPHNRNSFSFQTPSSSLSAAPSIIVVFVVGLVHHLPLIITVHFLNAALGGPGAVHALRRGEAQLHNEWKLGTYGRVRW